jgi:multidrug resistance efflux pump
MEALHLEAHRAIDKEPAEIDHAEAVEAYRSAVAAAAAAIAARQAAIDEADRAAERAHPGQSGFGGVGAPQQDSGGAKNRVSGPRPDSMDRRTSIALRPGRR